MSDAPDWPQLLVIARHGETLRNRLKATTRFFPDDAARAPIRGVSDHAMPLTPEGEAAARAAGVDLRRRHPVFDTAWNSGFVRTRATLEGFLVAWPEAERARMAVRQSILLRERDPALPL